MKNVWEMIQLVGTLEPALQSACAAAVKKAVRAVLEDHVRSAEREREALAKLKALLDEAGL